MLHFPAAYWISRVPSVSTDALRRKVYDVGNHSETSLVSSYSLWLSSSYYSCSFPFSFETTFFTEQVES